MWHAQTDERPGRCAIIQRIPAGINCYLIEGPRGRVLVDAGPAYASRRLLRGLAGAGVEAGSPLLVVLTHGDADHTGGCATLRERFDVRVAAHRHEVEAIRTANMLANRTERPDRLPWIFRAAPLFERIFGGTSPVELDLTVSDGQPLSPFGIDAAIVHIPGHSKGSIGVLTAEGDLFCGDLLWNLLRPRLHPLIDDLAAAQASLARLRALPLRTVYPAHGRPFAASRILAS